MKKTRILMVLVVSVLFFSGYANANLNFDGKPLSGNSFFQTLVDGIVPKTSDAVLVNVKSKSLKTSSYALTFYSAAAANAALPGLVKKFEGLGYLIIESSVRGEGVDHYSWWKAFVEFLSPAGNKVEFYGKSYYNEKEAQNFLPKAVKLIEASGYAVISARIDTYLDAGDKKVWKVCVDHIRPAK